MDLEHGMCALSTWPGCKSAVKRLRLLHRLVNPEKKAGESMWRCARPLDLQVCSHCFNPLPRLKFVPGDVSAAAIFF
jgi:hypothetical protein